MGALGENLRLKTPFDAVATWLKLDSTIFKENTEKFKLKILDLLNPKSKQEKTEQPCET